MLANQWYAVLSSRMLKKETMRAARRFGLDMVFYRDANGRAHALMDKCPHRGAALSKGAVQHGDIVCPFHGIQYNGAGEATHIPANGINSVADLKRFNVRSFPVYERYGIIFVWYGSGEPDQEVAFFPELIHKGDTVTELEDPWNTHYSRVIENQLDVAHLPFVHRRTIGRGHKTLVNGPKVEWLNENAFMHSADNAVDVGQNPLKPDDAHINKSYMKFIFPNMWLNAISDRFRILGIFIPVDESHTILILRLYNHITPYKSINRAIGKMVNHANRFVAHEDRRIVETQRPKASGLKIGETLLQADFPLIAYRKRRQELMSKSSVEDNEGK